MSIAKPTPLNGTSNGTLNGTSRVDLAAPLPADTMTTFRVKVGAAGVQPVSVLKNNNIDSNTVVAMWDLTVPRVKHAIESREFKTSSLLFSDEERAENVMPGNIISGRVRRLVSLKEYAPGGKYRAIVKLVMTYKGLPDSRFIGTGWLINRDLIATAGHNAFSWPSGSRTQPAELVEVEAYIGYQGAKTLQADIRSGQVQYRRVVTVSTTMQYLARKDQRQFDAAFFKVDRPFENVVPLPWRNTPTTGSLNIGIVGYPGDKTDGGQNGARMYEMFAPTKFNLKTAKFGMLQYTVDTYGGNSGGPVLSLDKTGKIVSIGVHTYGGADSNSGTVIGRYGVPFIDYVAAFSLRDSAKPPPKTLPYSWKGLTFISIPLASESYNRDVFQPPASGSKVRDPFRQSSEENPDPTGGQANNPQEGGEEADEEFWGEILRGAGTLLSKIPQDVLKSGAANLTKRFGLGADIGNLVGAGAHMAIMAAGRKLSSAENYDAESTQLTDGLAARAALAQAALETVYRLGDPDSRDELSEQQELRDAIVREMRTTFPKLKPFYRRAGLAVAPVVRDLTVRAALSQANQSEAPQSFEYPTESAEGTESRSGDEEGGEEFFGLLRGAIGLLFGGGESAEESGAESFGDLLNFIKRGTKIILPIAGGAVGGSLGRQIGQGLSSLLESMPESVEDGSGAAAVSALLPIENSAWQQAALAEAALLAMMKQPHETLKSTGALGFMACVVRKSGPGIIASEGLVRIAVPRLIEDSINRPKPSPGPITPPGPRGTEPPGLYTKRMWLRRVHYGTSGTNLSTESSSMQQTSAVSTYSATHESSEEATIIATDIESPTQQINGEPSVTNDSVEAAANGIDDF